MGKLEVNILNGKMPYVCFGEDGVMKDILIFAGGMITGEFLATLLYLLLAGIKKNKR